MKKIISLILALVLFSTAAFAAQGQDVEVDTGMGQQVQVQEGEQVQVQTTAGGQVKAQVKAGNAAELKVMVQARQQEMEQEMEGMDEDSQKVYKNQNKVRLAVHSLLAMEDIAGGIGSQVRAVATEFDNSVQATIRSEEKIQARGGFARFFAGGDADAAEEIEAEVSQNQARIQTLKQLKEQCSCSAEVKAMFQEQIQNMEQEQTRLQELAQSEKGKKGLFGWLWK